MHPDSIGPIWRTLIQSAFDAGGSNQDLFAIGVNLAGIMDALRWKSTRMPLAYNRNHAAGRAAIRLMKKLD